MDDDDSDFTFCPAGIPANEHQLEVLPTNKGTADPLPFNESDVQRVLFDKQETVLEKDKSLEKQEIVGSLSFNVVDLSTRKNDLPPPTTSIGSKDSSKDSEEQVAASTRKRVVRAKVPFEKGYSQMDWLRVTRTQHDLAGDDMLMKAAGKDCTSLFNKYQAWVNAEFLIEKCLVGVLDETQ